jgi:hypothetical protein
MTQSLHARQLLLQDLRIIFELSTQRAFSLHFVAKALSNIGLLFQPLKGNLFSIHRCTQIFFHVVNLLIRYSLPFPQLFDLNIHVSPLSRQCLVRLMDLQPP